MTRLHLVVLCSSWLLASGLTNVLADDPVAVGQWLAAENDSLDDRAGPLVSKSDRDGTEILRLEALSRFATGRRAEQHDDYATALRWYQRAFRSDPQAQAVVRRVIGLAASLGRGEVALRYAKKGVDIGLSEPPLLRQLAVQLTDRGELAEALRLHERARDGDPRSKNSPLGVTTAAEMGRLYFLTGRFAEAADSLATVVDALDHPEKYNLDDGLRHRLLRQSEASYELFGQAFLSAGRYDEAERAFRQAATATPIVTAWTVMPQGAAVHPKALAAAVTVNAEWAFHQAQVRLRRGDSAGAIAAIDRYLASRITTKDEAPFALLEKALEATGRAAEFSARLEALQQVQPKNAPLFRFRALRAAQQGDRSQSETLWLAAQRIEVSGPGFRGLAEIYRQQRNAERLLQLCGEIVDRTGALDVIDDEKTKIVADEQLLTSLIDYARSIDQQRNEGLPLDESLAMALLALQAERVEAAAEFFEQALSRPAGGDRDDRQRRGALLMAWGMGLVRARHWPEATKVFELLIAEKLLSATDWTQYYYLAATLEQQDRIEDALKVLEPRARRSPQLGLLYAEILSRTNRHSDAAERYQAILRRVDGQHEDSGLRDSLRRARISLSNIAVNLNQLDQAEEWLEQVLDEFPDDVGAANDLSYLWADANKRLAQAHEMSSRATAADPENAAYRDTLGWVLYRLGRFSEAVVELEAAVKLDETPDSVVLEHLGDCRLAMSQPEPAIAAWRLAVEALEKAAPRPPAAEQRLAVLQEKLRRHEAARSLGDEAPSTPPSETPSSP